MHRQSLPRLAAAPVGKKKPRARVCVPIKADFLRFLPGISVTVSAQSQNLCYCKPPGRITHTCIYMRTYTRGCICPGRPLSVSPPRGPNRMNIAWLGWPSGKIIVKEPLNAKTSERGANGWTENT